MTRVRADIFDTEDNSFLTKMKFLLLFGAGILLLGGLPQAKAGDFVIYGVQPALNMGNPGEKKQKDFYINVGTRHGVAKGQVLSVMRNVSTHDLVSKKLHQDITIPVGSVKIIHVERNVAIARTHKILPAQSSPVLGPRAIMVGDFVSVN